ncbi:MAG: hypothetical protein RKO25_13450 [Candidatus Contendobacter sp.]|nr:hypothetical protein [Candidatus Contendobacter sp.]
MRIKILTFLLLITMAATVASEDKKNVDPWLPMAERIKVWDAVVSRELGLPLPLKEPKPYRVEPNNIEAIFEKDRATWTIMGANAPIVNPTVYPKAWPVKGDGFEVLVVPEPITNYKILPFTDNIENAVKSDTISITAARDSYEPASFVIRTGDAPLRDIAIEWDDLKAEVRDERGNISYSFLPKSLIDIRVVKCWYQARGYYPGATPSDKIAKLMTPELLLHDDDLVRVDYATQVNMVKNYKNIADNEILLPFSIPAWQNKQLWMTVHVTKDTPPGIYKGQIYIKSSSVISQKINLNINVLPFILPPAMLDYALYYEGRLSDSDKPVVEAGLKTEKQMRAEFEDMIAHGLTNATTWHRVSQDQSQWEKDWVRIKKTLKIRKEVGWDHKPLLYLDWIVSFRDDLDTYKEKIKKIVSVAQENGVKEVYIYGVDEKTGQELAELKPLYKSVHEAGAKNFVAGNIEHFLQYADGLIDLLIIKGPYNDLKFKQVSEAKQQGKNVYYYNNPQAGLEYPAIYRQNFGINLYLSGANGALNYCYQNSPGWNDWHGITRPLFMAYPTIFKPISTIQWEGWREAVNDVRYLTLVKQNFGFNINYSPAKQRKFLLDFIYNNSALKN